MAARCRWFVGIAVLAGFLAAPTWSAEPAKQSRPRLAVLVVFDQMRGDYLTRWQGLFEKDGFRRLATEGAWFQNCNYPYADTVTAAGHASLLTGTTPHHHGIIANDWYESGAFHSRVTSVSSTRYKRLPEGNASARKGGGSSPDRLLAPTVGDVLKAATAKKARVLGLSLKDRSAILPAGRRADACYWFDAGTGNFVSSTYFFHQLPDWVTDFNRAHRVDCWAGSKWRHLRAELDYARYSGPDDVAAEGTGAAQGRVFPHPFPAKPGRLYYQAVYNSPLGNDLLLDFVAHAIDGEQLGPARCAGRALHQLFQQRSDRPLLGAGFAGSHGCHPAVGSDRARSAPSPG